MKIHWVLKAGLLGLVLIILLGIVSGVFTGSSSLIAGGNSFSLTCDVPLYNPVLGSVKILASDINCYSSKSTFCFGDQKSFAFFSDSGSAIMSVEGKSATKSYNIRELTGKPDAEIVSLKIPCISAGDHTVYFRAVDNIGNTVDSVSKTVSVGGV